MPSTHRPNPRFRRGARTLLASLAALSLVAAGCGGTSDEAASRAPATTIVIDTFAFVPGTVRVDVGDTVTWTNEDDIRHTVTSGSRDYEPGNSGKVTATRKDGTFDLELDGRGTTAEHTFATAGTYHYFCDVHPGMEAELEVS